MKKLLKRAAALVSAIGAILALLYVLGALAGGYHRVLNSQTI